MRQSRFYQKVGQSTPRAAYSRKAFAFGRFRLRVCLLHLAGLRVFAKWEVRWCLASQLEDNGSPSSILEKEVAQGRGELPLGPRRGFAALIDAPPLLF